MEIKATLNKPYTNAQRIDFIVTNNHQKGCEIRETEQALEAWEYTQEEIEEKQKQQQIEELKQQLNAIDLKKIRSTSAIALDIATNDDIAYLTELEQNAEAIRQQIRELQ